MMKEDTMVETKVKSTERLYMNRASYKLKALQIAIVVQAKEIYIPMAHATEVEVDIVVSVRVVQVGVKER